MENLNVLNNTDVPLVEPPKEQERINVNNIPPKSIGEREISRDFLSIVYPIGSIYISTVSTNPATLFGFGTWVAFGTGQTLVGIDTSQTEFDVVEETGGEKTHTLTTAELATHTHVQDAHTHLVSLWYGTGTINTKIGFRDANSLSDTNVSGSTTAVNQNTGSGTAHNNLQPYITCYFFKRQS